MLFMIVTSFCRTERRQFTVETNVEPMTGVAPLPQLSDHFALLGGERFGHGRHVKKATRRRQARALRFFCSFPKHAIATRNRVWEIDKHRFDVHLDAVPRQYLYRQVGQKVALAREGKLTQLELARRAGMSRPAIANIERGEQQIYLHQLLAIAGALDVNIGDLLPRRSYRPVVAADVSVSGDRLNRAQERAIKELVGSITQASRK